jgi:hypothetical protein
MTIDVQMGQARWAGTGTARKSTTRTRPSTEGIVPWASPARRSGRAWAASSARWPDTCNGPKMPPARRGPLSHSYIHIYIEQTLTSSSFPPSPHPGILQSPPLFSLPPSHPPQASALPPSTTTVPHTSSPAALGSRLGSRGDCRRQEARRRRGLRRQGACQVSCAPPPLAPGPGGVTPRLRRRLLGGWPGGRAPLPPAPGRAWWPLGSVAARQEDGRASPSALMLLNP